MIKPGILLGLSMVLAPHILAQPSPARDPLRLGKNVVGVVSGGDWTSGVVRGAVRIVVLREAVGNRIIVEWLDGRSDTPGVGVRQWIDLRSVAPNWTWSDMPTVAMSAGAPIMAVWAAAGPRGPGMTQLLFEIGAPGVVRRRSRASVREDGVQPG